jgi:hypothetical protein
MRCSCISNSGPGLGLQSVAYFTSIGAVLETVGTGTFLERPRRLHTQISMGGIPTEKLTLYIQYKC